MLAPSPYGNIAIIIISTTCITTCITITIIKCSWLEVYQATHLSLNSLKTFDVLKLLKNQNMPLNSLKSVAGIQVQKPF